MHEANIIDYFLQKDTYKNKLNALTNYSLVLQLTYINKKYTCIYEYKTTSI